jgi:hypothetical protein
MRHRFCELNKGAVHIHHYYRLMNRPSEQITEKALAMKIILLFGRLSAIPISEVNEALSERSETKLQS